MKLIDQFDIAQKIFDFEYGLKNCNVNLDDTTVLNIEFTDKYIDFNIQSTIDKTKVDHGRILCDEIFWLKTRKTRRKRLNKKYFVSLMKFVNT